MQHLEENRLIDMLIEKRYQEALVHAQSLLELTDKLVHNPYLLKTQRETVIVLSIILDDLRQLVNAIEEALETRS